MNQPQIQGGPPDLSAWVDFDSGLGFNGAQIIYYLIFRHIKTSKNRQNSLSNLQQLRRIYTRKSHLCAIESQTSQSWLFPRPQPDSAWADEKVADIAEQVG